MVGIARLEIRSATRQLRIFARTLAEISVTQMGPRWLDMRCNAVEWRAESVSAASAGHGRQASEDSCLWGLCGHLAYDNECRWKVSVEIDGSTNGVAQGSSQ